MLLKKQNKKIVFICGVIVSLQFSKTLYANDVVSHENKKQEISFEIENIKGLVQGIEKEKDELENRLQTFKGTQEILNNKIQELSDALKVIDEAIAKE